MEKIKPPIMTVSNGQPTEVPLDICSLKINELIDAHNKTVEAIKYLAVSKVDQNFSDEINKILNS